MCMLAINDFIEIDLMVGFSLKCTVFWNATQ